MVVVVLVVFEVVVVVDDEETFKEVFTLFEDDAVRLVRIFMLIVACDLVDVDILTKFLDGVNIESSFSILELAKKITIIN
jgi:hypothetical protein